MYLKSRAVRTDHKRVKENRNVVLFCNADKQTNKLRVSNIMFQLMFVLTFLKMVDYSLYVVTF